MKLLNKIKNKFQSLIVKKLFLSGVEIFRAQDIDIQIAKLRAIKEPITRLDSTEKLHSKHSKNPKVHLEFVSCLHMMNDNRQFEQMNIYPQLLKEWISKNKLEELNNMEFIGSAMAVGSFGSHYLMEGLLRANKYGLRTEKKLFMLLNENYQLRNPALFSYFEPYINVIRDKEVIHAMRGLESLLTLPLGISLPLNEKNPFLDIAANMLEVQRIKIGQDRSFFKLSEKHHSQGAQVLKKLGLPDDAWYVTLHVREPGYRGETRQNTTEDWRNANPLDYVNACKAITNAGGWVFRMGDPSMTLFPEMPQVIDYAHMDIRSDWMDIFLGATCSFLISTASGYQRVPGHFGIPSIYTNCTHSVPYFSLSENDLYLPRLLKYKANGKYLSFEEIMSPPISMLNKTDKFAKEGIEWIENTPNELEAVTIEMLNKTDNNNSSKTEDDLQRRFKILAEKCGKKYGGHNVKAFASVSHEFLYKHAELLEEVI